MTNLNKFGYSELYEWKEIPLVSPFGRFVQFSDEIPSLIELYNGGHLLGVTTINSVIESDNPSEWQGKYLCNEYGDNYMNNKYEYIENPEYDNSQLYVDRLQRKEWIKVNILGKCIVEDNGKCEIGKYCMPSKNGIAVPYDGTNGIEYFRIIARISEHTILIFYK